MRLQDYPRPPQDNGIGIHWSAGNPAAVGIGELRDRWLPELQRLGIKWVKMLHEGGYALAEMLLDAGIMPVVRLFRSQPNSTDIEKAVLPPELVEVVRQYVSIGVRYFEFNNEPELHSEWEGGKAPPNAIDYVARAAIRDMETILEVGGYPAVPAVAVGTKWDLVGRIIAHGGDYLFDQPVWLAVHNYDLNHPLDYPYDDVNQRGVEISQSEYDSLGTAAWDGGKWGLRTRAFVNQQRREGMNPGHTVHDDPSCFLAYRRLADLCYQHLGRHLPILSTENGPIVGEADDPRYPTTTPEIHAQKVVEIARIMMGTSEAYEAAPPYYFCTAFWLIANAELRAAGWERHAWYSSRWPGGRLPAVDALAALPKVARPVPQEAEQPEPESDIEKSVIAGIVHGYPDELVFIRSAGLSAQTMTDEVGRFRFEELPAGEYRLSVPAADVVKTGLRLDGMNQLRVEIGQEEEPTPEPEEEPLPGRWDVSVEDVGPSPGFGVVRVSVEGKIGLPVRISTDGWEGIVRETGSKPEYGPYALEFAPLGGGRYTIAPAEIGVSTDVDVDPARILFVTFRPLAEKAESVIAGTVVNGAGLTIVLSSDALERSQVIAADNTYRFEGLPAGTYSLRIPGTDARRSGLEMDGSNRRTANFTLPEEPEPRRSRISGRVTNGEGYTIVLRGPEGESVYLIGPDEMYAFERLPAGVYSLSIPGTDARRSGLEMNGLNQRTANFTVPAAGPETGVVFGTAPGGRGLDVVLRGPEDLEMAAHLDESEAFRFEGLVPGEYRLILFTPHGDVRETVQLDPGEEVEVTLVAPQAAAEEGAWTYTIEDGGPGPGYGIIRVRVEGKAGLPVRISTAGWSGMVRLAGEKPEYGPFVCDFAPLGGGVYVIEPEGLGVRAEVRIDGSRIVWVHFAPETPALSEGELPEKTSDLYLYVGAMPDERETYLLLLRYVAQAGPEVGDSLEEAMRARRVLLLGSELTIPKATEERLTAAGCETRRISPQEARAVLQELLASA
ncbi:MAG: carboxypeptidase regulatory-like domain-containing protein [Caldilineae bacterium]|nr:MAG: carboxypeptidase regulatory-like domain-containing protein [Caldilineae bacterium]